MAGWRERRGKRRCAVGVRKRAEDVRGESFDGIQYVADINDFCWERIDADF